MEENKSKQGEKFELYNTFINNVSSGLAATNYNITTLCNSNICSAYDTCNTYDNKLNTHEIRHNDRDLSDFLNAMIKLLIHKGIIKDENEIYEIYDSFKVMKKLED